MVFQTGEDMKQVRLRLAACRVSPSEEMMSELPREKQNTSSSKHVSVSGSTCVNLVSLPDIDKIVFPLCVEQKLDSCMNEEEEDGDDRPLTNHHECLLVKQKVKTQLT